MNNTKTFALDIKLHNDGLKITQRHELNELLLKHWQFSQTKAVK